MPHRLQGGRLGGGAAVTARLHYHPFASYCQKALIAFHETDEPFDGVVVHLEKADERNAFYALWPIGKFPVVETEGLLLAEATVVVEWLAHRHPAAGLLPADPAAALQVRLWDRIFDNRRHSLSSYLGR
jgi:glutathione S-transferase